MSLQMDRQILGGARDPLPRTVYYALGEDWSEMRDLGQDEMEDGQDAYKDILRYPFGVVQSIHSL